MQLKAHSTSISYSSIPSTFITLLHSSDVVMLPPTQDLHPGAKHGVAKKWDLELPTLKEMYVDHTFRYYGIKIKPIWRWHLWKIITMSHPWSRASFHHSTKISKTGPLGGNSRHVLSLPAWNQLRRTKLFASAMETVFSGLWHYKFSELKISTLKYAVMSSPTWDPIPPVLSSGCLRFT